MSTPSSSALQLSSRLSESISTLLSLVVKATLHTKSSVYIMLIAVASLDEKLDLC